MVKEKKFSVIPASEKAPILHTWLNEHKARDVVSFHLHEGNPLAEAVILATASSARHARSLADGISQFCRENKYENLRTEGYQEGQWILVDLNDIIIHIFQEPVRDLYHLESLWNDAEKMSIPAAASKESE